MPNYGHSSKGIPIVDIDTKVDFFKSCLEGGHFEDALGHIGDLFHYTLERFNQDMQDNGDATFSIRMAAETWIMSDPTPIVPPNVLDQMAKRIDG